MNKLELRVNGREDLNNILFEMLTKHNVYVEKVVASNVDDFFRIIFTIKETNDSENSLDGKPRAGIGFSEGEIIMPRE